MRPSSARCAARLATTALILLSGCGASQGTAQDPTSAAQVVEFASTSVGPPSTVVTPVSDEPAARRVFRPTQDVFTVKCDSYGSQNFANDDFIMVGGDKDGWVWHTLLQFDLRPISGMRVRSARLRLHPKEIYDGEEEDAEFRAFRVLEPWKDRDIVWSSQPRVSHEPYSNFVARRTEDGDDVYDLTELVALWLQRPEENFGVMLRPAHPPLKMRRGYVSSQGDAEHGPKLEVEVGGK